MMSCLPFHTHALLEEKKTNPGRNGICLFKKNRSDSICSAVAGWLHLGHCVHRRSAEGY